LTDECPEPIIREGLPRASNGRVDDWPLIAIDGRWASMRMALVAVVLLVNLSLPSLLGASIRGLGWVERTKSGRGTSVTF